MKKKTDKQFHSGDYCFICGHPATDTHHLLGGSNRRNSDNCGLTVKLCRGCHSRIHDSDQWLADFLKRIGQAAFEYKYDHEEWMAVFDRNYL